MRQHVFAIWIAFFSQHHVIIPIVPFLSLPFVLTSAAALVPWTLPTSVVRWQSLRLRQQWRRFTRAHRERRFPDKNAADIYFMKCALDEAKKAAKKGEVPIGAVVVKQIGTENGEAPMRCQTPTTVLPSSNYPSTVYEILSRAHNLVEARNDAIAHAEVLSMRQASNRLGNWRLYNCTLYCTIEPCPVCCASAQAFRVQRIVYGAPDVRLGAICTHMRLLEDYVHPYHNINVSKQVTGGVLEDECATILRTFFRQLRQKKNKWKKRPWPW